MVLSDAWSLLGFSENAAHTPGTLALTAGPHKVPLRFAGAFAQSDFTVASGASTIVGHA